ncbi:MAG TPA: flagellar hook-length control protein FliK, partial [Candidatus Kapabacteria bacterium]|nr:flagellar hook-length control protein FliK [Candidatus Kapabacteria bacterium]
CRMQLNNIKISQGCANSSNNVKNISQNNKLNLNNLFDFSQSEECNSALNGNNSYSSQDLDSFVLDSNANGEFIISINAFVAFPSFENEVQSLITNSNDTVNTELIDFDNIDSDNVLSNQECSTIEQQSQMLPVSILIENNDQSIEEKKEVSTKTEYDDSLPIEKTNTEKSGDLFFDYTILSDKSILNIKQNSNSVSQKILDLNDNNYNEISNPVIKENNKSETSTFLNPNDINIKEESETDLISNPVIKENKEDKKSLVLNKFEKENFEFEKEKIAANNLINNNELDIDSSVINNIKDSSSIINIAEDNVGVVNAIENNRNKEVTYSENQSSVSNQNLRSFPFEQKIDNSNYKSLKTNEKQNSNLNNEINNKITPDKPQNEISDELKNSKATQLNIQIENKEEIPKIEFRVSKDFNNKKEINTLKYDNTQNDKTIKSDSDNINPNQNNKQLQLLLSLKSNSYFPKETLSNNYVKTTNNNYSTIENLILNNYQVVNDINSKSADIPTLGNNNIDVENKTLQKIEKISIDEMKPNVLGEIAITKTENDSENADLNNNNSQNESNKDSKLNNISQKSNLNGIFSGVEIKQDEKFFSGIKIPENNQNEDIDTEIEGKNNSNDNKIQMNKNNQEFELINSLNKLQTGGNEINNSIKKIKAEHQLNQYTTKIYTNEFAKTTFNIISSMPENSIGTANLILKPASLGTIIVNINLKEKELNIDIRPENKEVAKSIENQIPQLKERLTGVGIQLESININDSRTEQDLAEKKQSKKEQKENNKEQEILQEYIRSFREIETEELMD